MSHDRGTKDKTAQVVHLFVFLYLLRSGGSGVSAMCCRFKMLFVVPQILAARHRYLCIINFEKPLCSCNLIPAYM